MNKSIFILILLLITSFSFAQEQEKEDEKTVRKANNYVYEGNTLLADKDDFVSAEMAYRKAISERSTTTAGIYNLGNSYYKSKNYDEALYRLDQASKTATSKEEKHKAFHNMGNILMKNKKCKEAVEAYKSALRNDPTDDETRYNLVIAKECAEQQKDQNKDDENKDDKDKKDQDKKDENKDKGDNKEDNKDKGDQDKKEGDDKKDDQGKPKDEKDNKEPQQPKPQPGQLSPQQIKNLLEAMNNQEQKVQEKVNAEKQKGVKVKTDKDW